MISLVPVSRRLMTTLPAATSAAFPVEELGAGGVAFAGIDVGADFLSELGGRFHDDALFVVLAEDGDDDHFAVGHFGGKD